MMLASLGADYMGFPLRLTHYRDDLPEKQVAAIIRRLPASVTPVLITYLDTAPEIRELIRQLDVTMVQLHGEIKPEEIILLKRYLPHIRIIKSLIIGQNSMASLTSCMQEFSPLVDFFITDTYDPVSGASGATGKTHDWPISRRLVEISPLPVILAGGLNPANIRDAIFAVKPFGVDAHTGVENETGEKDPDLIDKFIRRARKAFSDILQLKFT